VGDPRATLDKLFLNDLVAVDADRGGRNFLFVSRGGNYVLRAGLDANGKLNILDNGAPQKAKRLQTGNMPSGIVMSNDGTRAYTDNELNMSVTALDLTNNVVLARDMESSKPPALGTQEHRNLVGKLVFFTALGVPDIASRLKDQRALNWSAVRGSNTDFNQNAIGIQGGTGFAKETATGDRSALVFNHGPVFGISDSLDALQEWATTIRAPIVPDLA